MLTFDSDLFKARVYHGLKSILTPGDTLPPRFLEYSICQAFGMNHVGDGNFYADGYLGDIQMSVKTRMLNPHILKTKAGRDFQTNPAMFLGPHQNVKQNKWTAGLEIVQRRQQLDFKNDSTVPPKKIGVATLQGFKDNVDESYKKYNTTRSCEVVGVHGYSRPMMHGNNKLSSYIISLFWQEYKPVDTTKLTWVREGASVAGYIDINKVSQKVCERINGNAKREATCFKEYKDLTKYTYSVELEIPIPDTWTFNKDAILAEINLKEQNRGSLLFSE
jgi:hypothetical protein